MQISNKVKLILRPILIIGLVSIVISALHISEQLQFTEGLTYDWRMKNIRADKALSPDVAVILIDDVSLDALDNFAGQWPWPRYVYAEFMDFFSYTQPKGLLFDITFTEKRQFDPDKGETINPSDLELVEATAAYPFAYHAIRFLVDSISSDESKNVTLNRPLPDQFEEKFSLEKRKKFPDQQTRILENIQSPSNNEYYLPFDELLSTTQNIGVVETQADSDSVNRRVRLFHKYNQHHFASLSSTAIFDQNRYKSIVRNENVIQLDDLNIPVDKDEKVLINYYGKTNFYSFSGIIQSLSAIQRGELEEIIIHPDEFKDKYIFVGGSAAGLNDLKNTPMDAQLPGVFIHAAMANNIIHNDFLTPPNAHLTLFLIFIFSLITAISVLFIKKVLLQNSIPILTGVAFAYIAYYLFEQNIVIDMVPPVLSLLATWILSFTALVLMEGKEKRKFKRMMGQYLSPAVLNTLVANQDDFAKAEVGSKENITILFSDIRSFTNISEKLNAENVVEMLNHYFSSMTDSIFSHQGTIDKFIGDAIMAFWGAPIQSSNHADSATLSALDMINRLDVVNEWLKEKNLEPISIGIGIHTGDAILGNIGSENKLDYTIIGDNVNLASRIEGLTKQYGTPVLITEDTYNQLTVPIPCMTVDLVRVKGKVHPIKIMQPLVVPDQVDPETLVAANDLAKETDKVFEHYLNQEWQAALDLLDRLPKDTLHETMRSRCLDYQKTPPPDEWDGVLTMNTK